jgi:hypothetical protein
VVSVSASASSFASAALEFEDAISAIDASAAVAADQQNGRFEAFFRDDIGGEVALHKLIVQVHPMGFVCGWDEALVPFVDNVTARNEATFTGTTATLTAAFFQPNLTRAGVTYQCSCFERVCRSSFATCLNPTDPSAPGPCP